MQEEIIEKIKEEQLRIQQELAKENKELIFFEQFLRKIDYLCNLLFTYAL